MRTLTHVFVTAFLLSVAGTAFADGVLPAVATPVQREQAQARFVRGKELLSKNRYEEALAELRASHEIVASPNTRLQLGRCLRAMGKIVAAYAELGRSMVEAKELVAQDNRYQRAYDAAAAERAEIEPQLAFVTMTILNAADGSIVRVGGEEIRRAAWGEPAPVAAGTTEIVVETPGRSPVKRELTVGAGQKLQVTIDAQPAEAPPAAPVATAEPPQHPSWAKSPRNWAYVAGGVGAAGLLVSVVFGAMAQSTYNDLGSACHSGGCPPGKSDEILVGQEPGDRRQRGAWNRSGGGGGGGRPVRAPEAEPRRGGQRGRPRRPGLDDRAGDLVMRPGTRVSTAFAVLALATVNWRCTLDFDRYQATAADGGGGDAEPDTWVATQGPDAAETGAVDAGTVDVALDLGVAEGPCVPSAACLSQAGSCAMTCTQQYNRCVSKCNGMNMGCMNMCTSQRQSCGGQCISTCITCAQNAGCPASSDCLTAGSP